MQPGLLVYWQTRAHKTALVPGGPEEKMTRSPVTNGIILTLQTGQT
ncbi:MAG TPA: hypothetical protein V6C78_34515 [Crinalium sp.]